MYWLYDEFKNSPNAKKTKPKWKDEKSKAKLYPDRNNLYFWYENDLKVFDGKKINLLSETIMLNEKKVPETRRKTKSQEKIFMYFSNKCINHALHWIICSRIWWLHKDLLKFKMHPSIAA